jgi:hypothetical protein
MTLSCVKTKKDRKIAVTDHASVDRARFGAPTLRVAVDWLADDGWLGFTL